MKTHFLNLIAIFCAPLFLTAQQENQFLNTQQMLSKSSHNFFIENKGQWPKEVRYMAKIGGMNAWITKTGVVYDYYQISRNYKPEQTMNMPLHEKDEFERKNTGIKGHVVDMILEGANTEAKALPSGVQEGYYNYFIGNDSTKWASYVGLYSEVLVQDVYPGIDIRYYFDNGLIRYDYIAKPGANLAQINLKIKGSDGYKINEQGELTLKTSLGKITHGKLYAYQNIGNQKKEIACSFTKTKKGKIGVNAENYDPALALVIDPLVYSTFIGGSTTFEKSNAIVIDLEGNAVITGQTRSTDFPTTPGAYQVSFTAPWYPAFVTKLNKAGSALIYSTFIGGNTSSAEAFSIAIDKSGYVYIAGTASANFPTTAGAVDVTYSGIEPFVLKLSPSGASLSFSTYLGGIYGDAILGIKVDLNGNAFVIGYTNSPDFPVTSGAFDETINTGTSDVFVTKINSSGTALIYSTFIGGTNDEVGFAIAIDVNGNAIISGRTSSADYPTTSGAYDISLSGQDIFVSKLNATGTALIYSTFIGGNDQDNVYSIDIDGNSNAYITGDTKSTNYPTTTGAFDVSYNGGDFGDIYVTKLNATGKALVYSTYLGGSGDERGASIVVDSSGNAAISGYTNSKNYPTTNGAFDISNNGYRDVILTKMNATGSALIYSSYFGGSSDDEAYALANDKSANVFVTGRTGSSNFPVTSDAYDTSILIYQEDLFVAKISTIEPAINISFSNISTTAVNCSWTKGSGTKRAVFVKRTDKGTAEPKYNVTYTPSNTFESGSQIGTSGWYCVYNDTGSSVAIIGLAPWATYRVMVCEYIGNTGNESYNMDSVSNNPANFVTLMGQPTIQAHHLDFSNYATNSVTASWINGNGAARVVFITAANTGMASPANNTTYSPDTTFGSGTQIGSSGWYCIYNGTGNKVNISGLTSNSSYRLMVCEYNGLAAAELYNISTSANNPMNYDPIPTTQAFNISFSSVTSNSANVSWTNGNGIKRAVFMISGNTGTAAPSNNTTYSAGVNFGAGDQIGTSGWYCVYDGSGNNVSITGLTANTTYRVMVCEYNGSAGSEIYNISSSTNNPNNATTLQVIPSTQASNITLTNITNKTFTANCSKGNGTKRAFFVKAASSGTALPVNNTTYTANTSFGSGTQIGTSGWYCVYNDTGRTVNISNLQAGTTYTVMVCEYNGNPGAELYNTTSATDNPKTTSTTVGINDPNISKINIYPNPSNGQLKIENAKGCRLNIFNYLGVAVYSGDVNDDLFIADLKKVPDGTYLLKLEGARDSFSQKIVLRR